MRGFGSPRRAVPLGGAGVRDMFFPRSSSLTDAKPGRYGRLGGNGCRIGVGLMRAHSRLVLSSFLVLGAAFAAWPPGTAVAAAPSRPATSGTLAPGTSTRPAAAGGDMSLAYATGFPAAGHLIEGDSATQPAIRDKLNRSTYSTVP